MLRLFFVALLALSVNAAQQDRRATGSENDISGQWILVEKFRDETHVHRISLEVTGNKIAGKAGTSKLEGNIENSVLTFTWLLHAGQGVEASYSGRFQNGVLAGDGSQGEIK